MNDKILIMTAVAAEKEAVERGLGGREDYHVAIAGVGPVAAAVQTARELYAEEYRLVVSAGIAGGFAPLAGIGTLVVASASAAAELGAESPEGFLTIEEMGFGFSRLDAEGKLSQRLVDALTAAGLAARLAPIVTVSTATGSAETADELSRRVPGAAAEGMEGFGVATAASAAGLPFIELRAISNAVGPRDRSAWRFGEALSSLERACTILTEVMS